MPKKLQYSLRSGANIRPAENFAGGKWLKSWLRTGALQSAVFNSAHFSSIATDENGVIQIFNVGAERMLGYSAADVLNKLTLADISDPQEMQARAQALSIEFGTAVTPGIEALAFKSALGIEDIYELTYLRKDGSPLPSVVSVTALRDPQDSIIGYLLIGTDNTARRQIENDRKRFDQNLRDQQFYTRSLIESNIDALMATDPSGVITDVNKQMELLTGCSRNELIGTLSKKYFTDQDRAEAGIKKVLREKKVSNYELTALAKDGKETMVSYNAATFYDRDGNLQGVFADARDISELKKAEEVILDMAFHDALTGLPNRRLLTDRLNQTMAASKRSGRHGALIFLDMDNFKSLNDTQGHCVGDLLLVEVARRISSCVREVDVVARFGGDEFVVILGELVSDRAESAKQAGIVAEKIRNILSAPYQLEIRQQGKTDQTITHQCTSSLGVALFMDHEVSSEEVLKWADMAMYQAKNAGGNVVSFFDN